jgi:transposase
VIGLKDYEWDQIKDYLPGKEGDPGRTALDNRKFIGAVMWIAKSGAPWRFLPKEYGRWFSVHKRFSRWSKNGVWQKIFNALACNSDNEWLMIDSTIVKVHQDAATGGVGGKKGGQRSEGTETKKGNRKKRRRNNK